MSIQSILIASDLSARSDRALQRGILLARELGARVTLVSIVDDSIPEGMAAELVEKSRAHLDASATSLARGVVCNIRVETGDPITRLVDIVNSDDINLAVFGGHRSRGLLDGLRPTTVESVVSRSRTPVLLVVSPVHGDYTRVLAPVSFSSACHQAVEQSRKLAPGAIYKIYHAWMAPFEGLAGGQASDYARAIKRETEEQAASWSKDLPSDLPEVELTHDGIGASLHSAVREYAPDLIAVGATTRSMSFTGLGSFTADLVRDPPADVLIARGARSE